MVNQCYIKSGSSYIFAVTNKESNEINGAVLLLPGFSQSKSDIDYFMSHLSDKLVKSNYLTMQLDFYGHGDSYGKLEDLSWNIIIKNIESAVNNLRDRMEGPIYIVCRGIYCNALFHTKILNQCRMAVCVNPLKLIQSNLNFAHSWNGEIFEIVDLIQDEFVSDLFIAMGGELNNLMGQKTNKGFIMDSLRNSFAMQQFASKNITFINSLDNINDFLVADKYENVLADTMKGHAKKSFFRLPEWQYKLIDIINLIIIQGVK